MTSWPPASRPLSPRSSSRRPWSESCSRSPSRAAGGACPRSTCSPSGSTDGGPPTEDESLRGLHPMMADRLRLWRFANFSLERVPSTEDIYLFRGIARANPKDERLFAIAEVRDLTPVRDEDDRAVALPEFERMLLGALDAIRSFHAHQPPRRRALWNRVVLYAWPTLELSPEEIRSLVTRNARATAALGIEMVLLYASDARRRRQRGASGAAVLQPDGKRRRGRGRRPAHGSAAAAGRARPATDRGPAPRQPAPRRDREAPCPGRLGCRGRPALR